MNTNRMKGSRNGWPRLRLPAILGSLGLGLSAGLVIALFKEGDSYSRAAGDIFVIEAFLSFGVAWTAYLKKDGIRIFPGKNASKKSPPESWRDRIPQVGQEPPAMSSPPGPEGPHSPEYLRLAEAETRLRRRILGIQDEPGNANPAGEPETGAWSFVFSAGLVGTIFLVLGVLFAYLL